jgi:peroxiredoxin
MNTSSESSPDSTDDGIGSIAPDFQLPASDGREIRLSDFQGKNNVVLFFVREYI